MDRKRRQHDDHAETSSSLPTKRQRTLHNDLDNTIHGPQNTSLSHDDYTIAWICALHIEMAAACAMLDEIHDDLPRDANDSNTYMLGSIKKHNIVIVCLPTAQYGTNNAANVLTHLIRTFPSIRLGLMVGIGGGVPSMADIRLGDIVVGTKVMQCDLGKIVEDGQIRRTATPRILQNQVSTLVSTLRSTHEREPSRVPSILREKFEGLPGYSRPSLLDHLFCALYEHASSTPGCNECDDSKLVPRRRRESDDPQIHYGAIASGNQVMRSGTARDDIARQLDVICFEMEAAGLMDILPCLPIRGICDYSDSHKNKEWQRYAAATAAAYAGELLSVLPVAETQAKATYMPNPPRLVGSASCPCVRGHQYDNTGYHGTLHQGDVYLDQIDARKLQLIVASSDNPFFREILSISNENKDRLVALSEVVKQSSTSSQGLLVDLRNDLSTTRTTQSRLESLIQLRGNEANQEAVYNTHHRLGSPRVLQRQSVAGMGRLMISQTKTSFTMKAQNMQDIVYPLMGLMPNLSKILPHLVDGGEMNLTEADVVWLKDEFAELLESAHFASAGRHTEQVELAQTWHSMDENVAPGSKRKRKVQDEAEDRTGTSSKKRHKHPVYSSLCSSRTDKHNSRRYETPTGNLLVQTELRQGGMVLTICLSFTPDDNIPGVYRTGFTTVFRRYLGKQSIERCLTTFRVVEWEGSAFEAVANGDLRGLQTLLSKRTAFPTDRLLEGGNTLIGHSCREVQLPIWEFLLMSVEGTDPCETDSEGMNALRLLVQGFQDEELLATEVTEQDERQRVVLALVQSGCLEDESWPEREAEDGCLHLSGFLEQSAYRTDELSGMVSTFITRGAGLEIRDLFGKTPLLDDLSIPGELGLEIVDKLLKGGADIKAVDNKGNRVFHLVLEACQNSPDDLGKRLQLLVKHSFRSDLSQTNDQGYTPSDFALTPQLWPIWCRTIREKIPLETLLAQDYIAKADYQDQMSRPKKPISPKVVSKLDLVRWGVHQGEMAAPTPASLESDIHHKTPNQQCLCNVVSIPFVRWEAQDSPGQQLPGLPRCLACGGYILPADMENRKRVALHNTM